MTPPTQSTPSPADNAGSLLSQLREGWRPLPATVVLSLVLAGLRVRLSRSVVTMVTVILAIAFLTYTGLTAKLNQNLAQAAGTLSNISGPSSSEIRDAANSLEGLDFGVSLPPDPRRWLAIWLPGTSAQAKHQPVPAAEGELHTQELRQWLDGKSSPLSEEEVRTQSALVFEREARKLLPSFAYASAWTAGQRAQANFLTELLGRHPANPPAAPVLAEVVRVEAAKQAGTRLVSALRKAGVNTESTSKGSIADTWVIVMALMLCTVGIANAMLMSVTERFREIGTMKCLGAQDGFVVKLFLLESAFLGVAGAVFGVLLGVGITLSAGAFQFGAIAVSGFPWIAGLDVVALALLSGILLAVLGTAYPAILASRMKPVDALRVDE